jgi:hypothetical protein
MRTPFHQKIIRTTRRTLGDYQVRTRLKRLPNRRRMVNQRNKLTKLIKKMNSRLTNRLMNFSQRRLRLKRPQIKSRMKRINRGTKMKQKPKRTSQ